MSFLPSCKHYLDNLENQSSNGLCKNFNNENWAKIAKKCQFQLHIYFAQKALHTPV